MNIVATTITACRLGDAAPSGVAVCVKFFSHLFIDVEGDTGGRYEDFLPGKEVILEFENGARFDNIRSLRTESGAAYGVEVSSEPIRASDLHR